MHQPAVTAHRGHMTNTTATPQSPNSQAPNSQAPNSQAPNSQSSDPKIAAVQRLYDAFFQGDADAFVADLADDVDWAAGAASSSAPWYGARHGTDGARRFFGDIGANVAVSDFEQLSYAANDTDVFVAIRWTYTVNATGKKASMHMLHWWRFADGKIVWFRGLEDTEQTAAAFTC